METQVISVPGLVRIKPGALGRLGLYLARAKRRRVTLMHSSGLKSELLDLATASLAREGITIDAGITVEAASFEQASEQLAQLSSTTEAIIGLGGGKALDTAKYVAFLGRRPYYAVPTSLSNDGFCSPQSSLTLRGLRRSFPARLPVAVVIDTQVCLQAPLPLWWSGVGELVAKITAVRDWKLAFHACNEKVNDLAALLSDATVHQFMAYPERDLEGLRLLGSCLLLNGVAMELNGGSRPASGSEHLISHALDQISKRPRLHGLQVGTAAYLVAHLQGANADKIGNVLIHTGFWDGVRADPFSRSEWLQASRKAPFIKPSFHTVLSERDCLREIQRLIDLDPLLNGCFVN